MKKKYNNNYYNEKRKKKKFVQKNLGWATAHLYCKKNIVLQLKGLKGLVYCNTLLKGEVYCNRYCIASWERKW